MLKAKQSLRDSYKKKILSGEKEYKPLKANSTLKANKSLRSSYANKIKSGEKKPYKYKPKTLNKNKLSSIFTDDLYRCIVTNSYDNVHLHHIFGAANKTNSEDYGFLAPLRADYHDMSDYSIHFDKEFDLRLKRKCQDYWLKHYGTKEEFIQIFGKWW